MLGANVLQTCIEKWRYTLLTFLLCLGSGCLVYFSTWFQNFANAVWPPAGVALGTVLLWGPAALPGVYIAEFALHYQRFCQIDGLGGKIIYLVLPLTSVVHAWLGSVLVKRLADYPNELVSLRSILSFFLLCGPVAATISSFLRISALYYCGDAVGDDIGFKFVSLVLAQSTGVAVFTPLFFTVFDKSHRIWRQRIFSLGFPVISMFILITVAYLYNQNKELQRLEKVVSYQSETIKSGLEDELQTHIEILTRLSRIAHQEVLTENSFRILAQADLRLHPDIIRLQWFKVTNGGRAPDFVNLYTESRVYNNAVEFVSIPAILAKLNLNLNKDTQTYLGQHQYLVAIPDFATNAKNVIVGIFDIQESLENVIKRGNNKHVAVKLVNNIASETGSSPFDEVAKITDPLALSKTEIVKHLGFLQVSPSASFIDEYYSHSPWQLLLSGMFLTAFMSLGLLVLTGHTEFVSAQVDKRTQELRQINQRLTASEKQFRKLVETQSAIVWRADPVTFKFLFVSSEAVSILGYPVKQWLTEPDFWQNHLHISDKENVLRALSRDGMGKSRNYDLEYRMIAADGHIVWLRDIATVVVEAGVITELYGFMIDITKQKHFEEQLRLAANTFESQQGIMITDKDANILRVNKAFSQITGYSPQQVIGKNPKILKSGRHDHSFFQKYWHQLLTFDKFEGEIWNRRRNGEIYPEWQTVTAVRNDAGEISHFVSVFSDITEKKDAENKIHNMAFYDPLTNLPNRRLLLDRFDQEIAIARRHKQFGAILYLDLDHFKILNDSQGHLVGDELLIQVAQRLSSVLREEDTPARLGGDEFVVLLHANSESLTAAADHAMVVAEKIREQLNSPFILNNYQHQIGTSIGVSLFPEYDETPDLLLQQADTAMYRSKSSGRNTISFFQPSMQQAADLRLSLEQDLRGAIDQGRFILCYHPQTDANGKLVGAEALIRWEDSVKGRLSPADFIPVAEESNLILTIGKWVLMEACNQIKIWQEAGFSNLPFLSINVSPRQFRQPDFVNQVKQAIMHTGIMPQSLSIELTESAMILDTQDTIDKMNALKAIGVSIAVDDFGTGYSSLVHLKQLPIDVLKIDKAFIRDILTDVNDAIIVETIISMAKHLHIGVIAEGVESAEQLAFLQEKGCVIFQGFYFSQPLTSASFAEKYLKT